MKRLLYLFAFIFTSVCCWAGEDVTFTTNAPDVVVSGDQFRLTYTVTTQKVRDFRAPTIKGFEVLMGPSRSSQSSTQIINGKVSSTSSITFTYILMAEKEGTYQISGATIVADGENLTSNPVTIKVLPPDKANGESADASNGNSSSRNQSETKVGSNELFILATANKTTVYEQEAILLTYKVYTTVNLTQLYGDMPDMQGFHSQEVELPQQKTWSIERYKDRNYQTTVYRQYVLFPQKSGTLEIPSVTFDGVVAQRVTTSDPFDAFFNGGMNYVEQKKKLVTPKVNIQVKPLPAKPANYSSGVGEFSLTSSINTTQCKTNDAITIKLTISGTGNMKLINTPDIDFPQDFEVYDPKIDNNFSLSRDGLTGSKTIEYLAIPRHPGKFTIPAIEMAYFDLKSQSYKVLRTQPYEITVEKGEGNAEQVIANFSNKENVKLIGSDIRFIKLGKPHLLKKNETFFASTAYYLWYIVSALVFMAIVLLTSKKHAQNSNKSLLKMKKANKVAVKRMKIAGKLLKEKKQNEFYDEVLKAMWGYISDKLSISVSELSKNNIEEKLTQKNVSSAMISDFIKVLNDCEFARYAPGNQTEKMDNIYSSAIDIISKIENSIKH